MSKRFLFLLISIVLVTTFTISCDTYGCDYVKIINNDEHNITWVVIIDTETGYAVESERDNELIAKNGGSKLFEERGKLIVCVKTEDNSEFICTTTLTLNCGVNYLGKTTTIVWNGSDDPAWQPLKKDVNTENPIRE